MTDLKPLEWVNAPDGTTVSARAFGLHAFYRLQRAGDGWDLVYPEDKGYFYDKYHDTQIEAKKQAEIIHRAIVFEHLEPVTLDKELVEALGALLFWVDYNGNSKSAGDIQSLNDAAKVARAALSKAKGEA